MQLININNANEKIKSLEEQNNKLKSISSVQLEEMEKYRNKISYLEKENSVKINDNVHLEQKVKELEKNVGKLTTDNSLLKNVQVETILQLKQVEDKSLSLEKEIKDINLLYRNSLDQLNKKIEEKEEATKLYKESLLKIDLLKQTNQIKDKESSGHLGAVSEQVQVLKVQIDQCQNTIEQLRVENLKQKKEEVRLMGELERLSIQKESIENQLMQEKHALINANTKIVTISQEAENWKNKYETLEKNHQDLISDHNQQLAFHKKLELDAEKRSEELNSMITEKSNYIIKMEDQFRNVQNTFNSINSTKELTDTELQMKTQRIYELELKLTEISEKNTKLVDQVDTCNKNYMLMEAKYKSEIDLMKEMDAMNKNNTLNRKVANPIGHSTNKRATWNFGKFFSPNKNTPQKSALGMPDHEGFLWKQGMGILKRWEKRWVILKNNTLYYLKDKDSEDIRGSMAVDGASAQEAIVDKRKDCFAVSIPEKEVNKPNKRILFQAASESDMKKWIEVFNRLTSEEVELDMF